MLAGELKPDKLKLPFKLVGGFDMTVIPLVIFYLSQD